MIGISFSKIMATEIISSDSFQSLAGQLSATKLGIEINHPFLKNGVLATPALHGGV